MPKSPNPAPRLTPAATDAYRSAADLMVDLLIMKRPAQFRTADLKAMAPQRADDYLEQMHPEARLASGKHG